MSVLPPQGFKTVKLLAQAHYFPSSKYLKVHFGWVTAQSAKENSPFVPTRHLSWNLLTRNFAWKKLITLLFFFHPCIPDNKSSCYILLSLNIHWFVSGTSLLTNKHSPPKLIELFFYLFKNNTDLFAHFYFYSLNSDVYIVALKLKLIFKVAMNNLHMVLAVL